MNPQPAVWFGPRGGATLLIARAIDAATSSLLISMYEFNSWKLAAAVASAAKRGVYVRLIIDARLTQKEKAITRDLAAAGVRIYLDAEHRIMHNKYAVIDDRTLLTGSMNWTDQAEDDHAENVVQIVDPLLCCQYTNNAETHMKHSTRMLPESARGAA